MKHLSSENIVSIFLDFFQKRDHLRIEAAPLIPQNDPTLLYINSGMAPLKPYFLGLETPPKPDLCNVQRCIRTNDIDSVGDRHHLTFFEMLGSWSIGHYWKQRAIELAWELLTEGFGFPKERLYATVYKGDPANNIPPDEESARVWRSVGMPEDHIILLGEDNFWGPAGQWGPCGPCTEVFFDTGDAFGPAYRPGGHFDDKGRYIEIWNAGVFMQYDKQPDGLHPLDIRSVDTGSGVERMAMAINGLDSCYDTDLLKPLVDYSRSQLSSGVDESALRIIADHTRAATLIFADGGVPAATGRGYIPRRMIRRAVAASAQAEGWDFDFDGLVDLAIANAKPWNSHVQREQNRIRKVFKSEVQDFHKTLKAGLQRLAGAFEEEKRQLSSGTAFRLFSTYGIPIDVIQEFVASRGGGLDLDGFEAELASHQVVSRAGPAQGDTEQSRIADLTVPDDMPGTAFLGYEADSSEGRILAIFRDGQSVEAADSGRAVVLADRTPFYAEAGGQIGDIGTLVTQGGEFEVHDTRKVAGDRIAHVGEVVRGTLRVGESAELQIDAERRRRLRRSHSATHLLHQALRQRLGEHVIQKGSLVAPDRLRFDFSHPSPLTAEDLRAIETELNREIRENTDVEVHKTTMDEALERGALALFGEKYGDEVRVIAMGRGGESERRFSVELCGGIHVRRTGDIGLFKIVSEGAVAAGVRRIEALTGEAAEEHVAGLEDLVRQTAEAAKVNAPELPARIARLVEERRALERALKKAQQGSLATGPAAADRQAGVKEVGGIKLIRRVVEGLPGKELKGLADALKKDLDSGVVAVASRDHDKASLVVSVTSDLTGRINAVDLVRSGAEVLGGKGGGGRPDMAQAGGPNGDMADAALNAIEGAIDALA